VELLACFCGNECRMRSLASKGKNWAKKTKVKVDTAYMVCAECKFIRQLILT
jgi:hypothetical protein